VDALSASQRGSLDLADKGEADKKFAGIKAAILNGTYERAKPAVKAAPTPAVDDRPSVATVADCYLKQYVETKRGTEAAGHHASILKFLSTVMLPCGVAFAEKPFRSVTQEDIEIAIAQKRQPTLTTFRNENGRTWQRMIGGDVAANRMHAHLSALWSWAIQPKRAYAEGSPFSHAGRVPDELKKPKEHSRDRRLHPGEEEALLTHAPANLHDCIVAALETGMRKNEVLSLQWRHVRWMQNELLIEWQNTKTEHSRVIPISLTLRELLVRRQKSHPVGQSWKPTDFVFGDEVGTRVGDIRTAWDSTVLKAHGIKQPRGHRGVIPAEHRARLHEIDLHFHDLRHEAGSRKLESGWPLHAVSHWLGHTKITTTATYLNATVRLLHELNERKPLTLVRG
jgi:integrase